MALLSPFRFQKIPSEETSTARPLPRPRFFLSFLLLFVAGRSSGPTPSFFFHFWGEGGGGQHSIYPPPFFVFFFKCVCVCVESGLCQLRVLFILHFQIVVSIEFSLLPPTPPPPTTLLPRSSILSPPLTFQLLKKLII